MNRFDFPKSDTREEMSRTYDFHRIQVLESRLLDLEYDLRHEVGDFDEVAEKIADCRYELSELRSGI